MDNRRSQDGAQTARPHLMTSGAAKNVPPPSGPQLMTTRDTTYYDEAAKRASRSQNKHVLSRNMNQ